MLWGLIPCVGVNRSLAGSKAKWFFAVGSTGASVGTLAYCANGGTLAGEVGRPEREDQDELAGS